MSKNKQINEDVVIFGIAMASMTIIMVVALIWGR
jgi:hypothetical protein